MFSLSPSYSSMIWASSEVPSVAVTSACVSPRVNSAEPCVRGSRPTSQEIGRISEKARPSSRRPAMMVSRVRTLTRSSAALATCLRLSASASGTRETAAFLTALISAYDAILLGIVIAASIGSCQARRTSAKSSGEYSSGEVQFGF